MKGNFFYKKTDYIIEIKEDKLKELNQQIKTSKNFALYYEERKSPNIGTFFYIHQIVTPSWKLHDNFDKYYFKQVKFKWFVISLLSIISFFIIRKIYYFIKDYYY